MGQQGIVVTRRLLWALASAAAIIAGSLGPWVTAGPFSVGGTHGDGDYSLALGIIALILIIAERSRPAVAAVAGAALAIGAVDASMVLRTDDSEIFDVGLGWGLIVLPLGAASLLAWGVLEVLQRKTSRRGVALTAATVALAATAVILAAGGRFDDPNKSDEPVAGVADKAAVQKTAPKVPEGQSCDELGINAKQRREGDCIAKNGWKVHVVNPSSTATVGDLAVSLVDVQTRDSIRDLTGDEVRPEGVFVDVTLRVTNRSPKPVSLDTSLFALTANGTTNTPTSAAVTEDQLGSAGTLGPGLSRTGSVIFDVAHSTAAAIPDNGNIVMAQPSDPGGLDQPAKRVAFIRTYGEDAPGRAQAENTAAERSPVAGMEVMDALVTPSGRIACEMLQDLHEGGNGVRCGLGGATSIELAERGRAAPGEWSSSSAPNPSPGEYSVTYVASGGTWKLDHGGSAVSCRIDVTRGVMCRNGDGHGFALARQGRRRF
jgi:hypothetical protein